MHECDDKQNSMIHGRALTATRSLSVKEIMIPKTAFVRADSAGKARGVFKQHPDIDMLPIPANGEPTHIIFRGNSQVRPIPRSMLISESTPIVDLARMFHEAHDGFFVLSGRSIAGLVHFSDLNSPVCKIPYFALTEFIEGLLLSQISKEEVTVENLTPILGRDKALGILKRVRDLADMLPTPAAAMYFKELLTYCKGRKGIALDAKDIKLLNEFRNRLHHAGRKLITSPDDKTFVVEAEELCVRLSASIVAGS